VVRNETKEEIVFQTGSSTVMKWAVGWAAKDVLVLHSSDIGIYSYDIKGSRLVQRSPSESEKEAARVAYETRYGKRPEF